MFSSVEEEPMTCRVCQSCGGPASRGSKMCRPCYRAATRDKAHPRRCCDCGGECYRYAKRCASCHATWVAGTANQSLCADCGVPIGPRARRCQACVNSERRARAEEEAEYWLMEYNFFLAFGWAEREVIDHLARAFAVTPQVVKRRVHAAETRKLQAA